MPQEADQAGVGHRPHSASRVANVVDQLVLNKKLVQNDWNRTELATKKDKIVSSSVEEPEPEQQVPEPEQQIFPLAEPETEPE